VIDERDFVRAAGFKLKDMQSETIHKYHQAGTFTYQSVHQLKASNNVIVHSWQFLVN
jgi:hypothetical protein